MSESTSRPLVSAGEIHHLTVGVSDMATSLPFYQQGLGLKKTLDTMVSGGAFERMLQLPPNSEVRTVFLQGPTRVGQIELAEWRVPGAQPHPPARPGAPGFCVVSFSVTADEIDAVYDQLGAVGAPRWTPPEPSLLEGYGTIRAFIAEDPDGNLIEVVSLPSDDEIAELRRAASS